MRPVDVQRVSTRARFASVLFLAVVSASLILPTAALGAQRPVNTNRAPVANDSDGASAWSDVAGRPPDSHGGNPASLELTSFRALRLNESAIGDTLARAPLERPTEARRSDGTVLSLPNPLGGFELFEIVESPIMPDEMAALHPDIKTYRGLSLDSGSTLRADLTPLGFHASVRGENGNWYIDPYYHLDTSLYASYFGRDLINSHGPLVERDATNGELSLDKAYYHAVESVHLSGSGFEPNGNITITISDPTGNADERVLSTTSNDSGAFSATFVADPDGKLDMRIVIASDGTNESQTSYQVVREDDPTADPPTGLINRVYRLALVTDPGYATFFGGPANVTPAKVTLMNRVNQLYQEDLSISMVFVPNNDLLNLDTWQKATAPNGPCGAAGCYAQADVTGCNSLARNRIVIGQIIKDTPYDIGHLALGQPGGGIAQLGVVGQANKGQGCTGIPTPVGDFYAIDYVAHEMGHQFSGNHTFNGNQLNCSGGNRNGGTSVEPGSGSSIMAYAGICYSDDLQAHSDPYFSQRSLQEISTYTGTAPTANLNEIQTASLVHFGGGNEVQTVTFSPGFQQANTIRPLSVALGAAPSATQLGGAAKIGNVVTHSTGAAGATHGLRVGDTVTISGVAVSGYNGGPFTVTEVPTTRTFRYVAADSTPLATSGGGTVTLNQPGLSESGNTVTVRVTAAHNRTAGQEIVITGAGVSGYNGTWVIDSIVDDRTFTYTNPTAGLANSGAGTVTYTTPFKISIGGNDSVVIGSGGLAYSNANLTTAINGISGFAGTATASGAASTGFVVTYTGASAAIDVPNLAVTMLSCGPCNEAIVQETNHGGAFDSFKIRYNGNDTIAFTQGTNYSAANIDAALETLFGTTTSVAVTGFGGGTFSNTGFQVTFSNTLAATNLPFLMEIVDTTPLMSGWFGETLNGGTNTRGGGLNVDPSGNTFPSVNGAANKSIPRRTPFYLTGSATDAEQANLWMWWEQNNTGASAVSLMNNNKTTGPLFAMFPYSGQISPSDALLSPSPGQNAIPVNTPTRVFPDMGQIIANNTNAETGSCPDSAGIISPQVAQPVVECMAEFLPTAAYGASMTFRFTVRDGLGGVNAAATDTTLTLVASTGPFLVSSPNTAVSWESGSTQTVTWDVAGTNTPALAENVKISLSTDGGWTYPTVLNASTPNDGTEDVTIPNTNSTTARIKIEAVDNYFFDISNADFTIAKAGTTVGLASSVNPSVHGESVSFTATVSSAGGTPTGNVQFAIDGTDFGAPVALVGGQATSDATSSLSTGSHNVTATYAGDDGFTGATSDPLSQMVNKANTSTSVISNADPSVTGQGVTFTATVSASAPGSGTPTGTVQFSVDGADVGSPVALNGVGQATSAAISNMSVGSHTIGAAYAGDADFNTSSGSVGQTVNKADTTTTITNGGELGSDTVVGESYTVKWSVTANAPGGGTPSGGTVEVTGGSGCTAAVSAGQCDVTSTESGAKSLVATYSGDISYNGSTSSSGPHNVNNADTTTALNSSANPSVHGQSVSFTATVSVTAPGSGTPTGTVQFKIDGSDFGSPVALASGQATSGSISSLSTVTHTITATYSGDSNFNSSVSPNLNQVVNKANTTTAVVSSQNPSSFGSSVSFTATVSAAAPGSGTPTGLVQFKIDGSNFGSPVSLNGSGQATSGTISSLSAGSHTVTVEYGGDTDFNGSTSGNLNQVVNKANSSTTVSSSANPSKHGQAVSFTATVTGPGGTPAGQVQFKVDGNNLGSPVTLNGAGQATSISTTTLTTGSHSVRAYYLGSASHNASTSAVLTQVVQKAATSGTVSTSPSPSVFGNKFTITANFVAVAPGAGTPKGKVQFWIDGQKFRKPVKLNASGVATVKVKIALTRGNHTIRAEYLGNKNFTGSTTPNRTHRVN